MHPVTDAILEHGLGAHEASLLWAICMSKPSGRASLMAASGIKTTRKLTQSLSVLEEIGLIERVRKSCVYDAKKLRKRCENAPSLTRARVNNNPSKEGESKDSALLRKEPISKSADADCDLVSNKVLMDRLLIIRIGTEPLSDELIVAPVSDVRRPLALNAYVDAWNARIEQVKSMRAEDGLTDADITDADIKRQYDFAKWAFQYGTENEPDADWLMARWKQRLKKQRERERKYKRAA